MTPEERQAVRERVERCLPGPWAAVVTKYHGVERRKQRIVICTAQDSIATLTASEGMEVHEMPEAVFIAAARTDLPALLADVERLEGENARLKEVAAKAFSRGRQEGELGPRC